jgi:hypothetical protein
VATDSPTPLCTAADLQSGGFADLVGSFSEQAIDDLCVEASRACETEVTRRLMPFTVTESHRAEGIDVDELGVLGSGIPLDLNATLGASYAASLGGGFNLVRRIWLNECAPLYPDMWTYSNVVARATTSVGGTNTLATPLAGPMPDTGLVWWQLGTFLPPGTLIVVTYSGGYTTVPADLRRAAKYMAASIAVKELDPQASTGHNAADLVADAVAWLSPYRRS